MANAPSTQDDGIALRPGTLVRYTAQLPTKQYLYGNIEHRRTQGIPQGFYYVLWRREMGSGGGYSLIHASELKRVCANCLEPMQNHVNRRCLFGTTSWE